MANYYDPRRWLWRHLIHKDEETGEYGGEAVFGFIVGNRGAGKSVGVGLACLDEFFKYGYKTALIRRYIKNFEDTKQRAMENFWEKCWKFSPYSEDHALTFEGHYAYIDGVLFSYPVALNLFNDYKNVNFENVHTIIYDEFITEQGSRLDNEVFAFYNIYDTIARGREDAKQTTKAVFMSNAVTYANDFFVELGIDREIRENTKKLLRPDKGYCVEIVNNENVSHETYTSPIGRLMSSGAVGQEYLGYSQSNKTKDDNSFIEQPPRGKSVYICNFTIEDKIYAVLHYPESDIIYFTDKGTNPGFAKNYALTTKDHKTNTALITGALRYSFIRYKQAYAAGRLLFNSQRSKRAFLDIFKYL